MTSAEFRTMQKDKPSGSKYGNTWTEVDGIKFQSIAEAERYGLLKLLKSKGHIKDFKRQVTFALVVNGVLICNYRADFVVYNNDGSREVEDVKSDGTENIYSFTIKRNLMWAIHGIKIKIVKK